MYSLHCWIAYFIIPESQSSLKCSFFPMWNPNNDSLDRSKPMSLFTTNWSAWHNISFYKFIVESKNTESVLVCVCAPGIFKTN